MYTRFEIEPDYADALRAAGLADFDALMNAPAGPPTSKHRHRETVPIEFDVAGQRKRFFLKRVFKVPAQHGWRPWLRGKPGYSQPVREWDAIQMMSDAGIPVMKRVAIGERRRFGIPMRALILVEDVGMQWTLENWLVEGFPAPPGFEKADTRRLWYELGRLQRRIDEAAILWPDSHAKHVFAEPTAAIGIDDARWLFALVDVERAIRRPPLPHQKRLQSDQVSPLLWPPELQSFLGSIVPRRDGSAGSMPFAFGYFGKPLVDVPSIPVEKIPFSADRYAATLSLPDGFVHPRAETVRWDGGIKAAWPDRAMLAGIGIQNVDSAFSLANGNQLNKPGLQPHRDRIRLITRDDRGRETTVYLKRYRRPPIREQVRRMIEADRAHSTGYREYQNARRLRESGIPAMRVLAAGEEMSGWWEQRSFVVMEAVEGESLEALARRWQAHPESRPDFRARWALIEHLGRLQYHLRAAHFFHRDFYLSHIFLSRNARGESVLQLIDLARILHKPRMEKRWEIKDLAALIYSVPSGLITRTDALRFLRAAHYPHYWVSQNVRRADPLAVRYRQELIDRIRLINRRVAKMARHDAKRAARLAGPNAPK